MTNCIRQVNTEKDVQIIRDMIKIENDLITTRIGWMGLLQGVLLSGLGILLSNKSDSDKLSELVSFIPYAGIFLSSMSSWGVYLALKAKYNLCRMVPDYWLPPVIGYESKNHFSCSPNLGLPVGFLLLWLYVLVFKI